MFSLGFLSLVSHETGMCSGLERLGTYGWQFGIVYCFLSSVEVGNSEIYGLFLGAPFGVSPVRLFGQI